MTITAMCDMCSKTSLNIHSWLIPITSIPELDFVSKILRDTYNIKEVCPCCRNILIDCENAAEEAVRGVKTKEFTKKILFSLQMLRSETSILKC